MTSGSGAGSRTGTGSDGATGSGPSVRDGGLSGEAVTGSAGGGSVTDGVASGAGASTTGGTGDWGGAGAAPAAGSNTIWIAADSSGAGRIGTVTVQIAPVIAAACSTMDNRPKSENPPRAAESRARASPPGPMRPVRRGP